MTLNIGRFTPSQPLTPSDPVNGTYNAAGQTASSSGAGRTQGADTVVGDVPPFPTAEARAQVDRAADRVQELADSNRELHFTHDPDTSRLVVQVRDLEGNVLNTIPPSKALDVMSGGQL